MALLFPVSFVPLFTPQHEISRVAGAFIRSSVSPPHPVLVSSLRLRAGRLPLPGAGLRPSSPIPFSRPQSLLETGGRDLQLFVRVKAHCATVELLRREEEDLQSFLPAHLHATATPLCVSLP